MLVSVTAAYRYRQGFNHLRWDSVLQADRVAVDDTYCTNLQLMFSSGQFY